MPTSSKLAKLKEAAARKRKGALQEEPPVEMAKPAPKEAKPEAKAPQGEPKKAAPAERPAEQKSGPAAETERREPAARRSPAQRAPPGREAPARQAEAPAKPKDIFAGLPPLVRPAPVEPEKPIVWKARPAISGAINPELRERIQKILEAGGNEPAKKKPQPSSSGK
jgi:hypothetical protein